MYPCPQGGWAQPSYPPTHGVQYSDNGYTPSSYCYQPPTARHDGIPSEVKQQLREIIRDSIAEQCGPAYDDYAPKSVSNYGCQSQTPQCNGMPSKEQLFQIIRESVSEALNNQQQYDNHVPYSTERCNRGGRRKRRNRGPTCNYCYEYGHSKADCAEWLDQIEYELQIRKAELARRQESEIKCDFCHEFGHSQRDCAEWQAQAQCEMELRDAELARQQALKIKCDFCCDYGHNKDNCIWEAASREMERRQEASRKNNAPAVAAPNVAPVPTTDSHFDSSGSVVREVEVLVQADTIAQEVTCDFDGDLFNEKDAITSNHENSNVNDETQAVACHFDADVFEASLFESLFEARPTTIYETDCDVGLHEDLLNDDFPPDKVEEVLVVSKVPQVEEFNDEATRTVCGVADTPDTELVNLVSGDRRTHKMRKENAKAGKRSKHKTRRVGSHSKFNTTKTKSVPVQIQNAHRKHKKLKRCNSFEARLRGVRNHVRFKCSVLAVLSQNVLGCDSSHPGYTCHRREWKHVKWKGDSCARRTFSEHRKRKRRKNDEQIGLLF